MQYKMKFQYLMTLNVMLFTCKREQKKTCRTVIYLDNNHAFAKSIKNI